MSGIIAKNKTVVVPGEILAEGMDNVPGFGTYREGQNIISEMLGLLIVDGRALKLIPLAGKYTPKRGDTIICKVTDVSFNGWIVSTNSAYQAMLSMKDATDDYIVKGADLTKYYNIEDYLVAKVTTVTSQKQVNISMMGPGLRKLTGGRIIEVASNKVPRIIGKQGSMVSLLKQATGCGIIVGQNGLVWINGDADKELIVVKAIRKIEEESHLSGLTDKIKDFLEKETKTKIKMMNNDPNQADTK